MIITECPRDAMQGIHKFIPTEIKLRYINLLLKVGFQYLDMGSLVSAKAIPQLIDSKYIFENSISTSTKKLCIIANLRGAEEAVLISQLDCIGFPLSVSEEFQIRNTNKSISEAKDIVKQLLELTDKSGKELRCYLSMCFGNPYQEDYSIYKVQDMLNELSIMGVKTVYLSDTIGSATSELITEILSLSYSENSKIGLHLHSNAETAVNKIKVALESGCENFDMAILGKGGCPMAKDDLVGNLDTLTFKNYCDREKIELNWNEEKYYESIKVAEELFNLYK